MKKSNLTTTIVVAVIVGVLGFYGGTVYQKSKRPSFNPGKFMTANNNGNRQGNQFGRPLNGQITSLENNTLTVKSQDNSSKTVVYSSSTVVNKTQTGSLEDLKVGDQVMVIGKEDTSGTVTAQTISVGGVTLQPGQPE